MEFLVDEFCSEAVPEACVAPAAVPLTSAVDVAPIAFRMQILW